jgi:hypothetical protein
MKNIDSNLTKIMLRAAGEESSVYDTICELRPELIKGKSLEDYIESIHKAVELIDRFRNSGKIDIYKEGESGFITITDDIYNSYLFVK